MGYRGPEKDHRRAKRIRKPEELILLKAQYESEVTLRRVVFSRQHAPYGPLFHRFFVSTTYTIPKKKLIDQPQKWSLIHNPSSNRMGRKYSVNAGIKKQDFPVTYPSIGTATHCLFLSALRGCVVWGRDVKAYYHT